MVEILDKTKEWSERFGHLLKASPTTRFSHLYKGAVGGLEHVVSVDNGGSYMELWRTGESEYYATTGAAIKPLPGLAKGARLDEALDRFFVLMTKKGIPKKIKRLAGVRKHKDKQGSTAHHKVGSRARVEEHMRRVSEQPWEDIHGNLRDRKTGRVVEPSKKPRIRKNIMEKVDPEIGPSMSVGHRKPSDLSPESSMRKLAKRITKNVVALTGNQVGSGRVKPGKKTIQTRTPHAHGGKSQHSHPTRGPGFASATGAGDVHTRKLDGHKDAQGSTKHHKKPYGPKWSREQEDIKEHMRGGGKKSLEQIIRRLSIAEKHQLRIAHDTLKMPDEMVGGKGGPDKKQAKQIIRQLLGGKGRKVNSMEGGRVQPGGGTRPVQPRQSGPGVPTGYAPATGATPHSQPQPQYRYGRKACRCAEGEVAKTMKAVVR